MNTQDTTVSSDTEVNAATTVLVNISPVTHTHKKKGHFQTPSTCILQKVLIH